MRGELLFKGKCDRCQTSFRKEYKDIFPEKFLVTIKYYDNYDNIEGVINLCVDCLIKEIKDDADSIIFNLIKDQDDENKKIKKDIDSLNEVITQLDNLKEDNNG